ncbi:uncharacterized protein LOC111346004, partial [Stylophora pistillata]|uniref:uncharacterized protein LOC111346004 n=1 Tax=Stylophora pistillata TaxID=50429 RepID=UPI000C04F254
FELTRFYRASKWNPTFTRTIATVKGIKEKELKPYYLVIYKWTEGEKEFVTQRHGNAKKPTSSSYFCKDPEVFSTIDNLLDKGMSTDRIYSEMADRNTDTVSQTISDPKMIANRRYHYKSSGDTSTATEYSEAESLIAGLHKVPILNSVTFTKEQYTSVNVPSHVMNDIYRFCVLGNSILHVDTTFELVDGLWLTDTSFQHEGLINERNANKHPEFPGPSFWHFRKNRETYRRFAGELLIQKPELSGIQKIGHDLDKAIARGMTDVFQDAKNVWCTQHIKERDLLHLKSIGANEKTQKRILTDIYGCQQDILQQDGLADSDDEEDFDAKLQSLRPIWETLAPGFHSWFIKHRSEQFKSCLIHSAREDLGLDGRFYTNGLELKHKLQKKRLREDEVPKEVAEVSSTLEKWTNEFYVEEERALRGMGKYRLAPGYDQFKIDPVTWNKWGPERQSQHLIAFRNFLWKGVRKFRLLCYVMKNVYYAIVIL